MAVSRTDTATQGQGHVQASGGRRTNSRIDPTRDNPKLRHFCWLLNRPTAIMTNTNDVI